MIPFRKTLTLLLVALTYLVSTNLYAADTNKPAPPEVIDRIVAVVNSDVITLSDLTDRTNLIAKQLQKQNIHHKLSYYFIFLNILSIRISSVTPFLDFHINVAFPTIYSSGKGPQ